MLKSTFFTATVILLISSCYYDKKNELYGATSCDTAAVTYTKSIQPLVSAQCTGCHGATSPSAGISLNDYASVRQSVEFGTFSSSVNWDSKVVSNMPKGGSKWSTCDLSKLRIWQQKGFPQ